MVDTDVDPLTCDYCGERIEQSDGESPFEAFTSHFEACHAAEALGTPDPTNPEQADAERGAGD